MRAVGAGEGAVVSGKIIGHVADHRKGMSATGKASVDGVALAWTGLLAVKLLPDKVLREIGDRPPVELRQVV